MHKLIRIGKAAKDYFLGDESWDTRNILTEIYRINTQI